MGKRGFGKEAKELKELAEKDPAVDRVEDRTKHWMVFPKDKTVRPVRIPTTPSDWRSLENCKSDLRKAGLTIPHKGGKAGKKK